jgi:flagellar hook protein FlgE
MSLSGAINAAVSALGAQSSALAIVSNNLANSSTTGYKASYASFESLLTDATSATGGVTSHAASNVTAQGMLTTTTTSSNMAITGSGFFVVSSNANGTDTSYTRNGEFTVDSSGYLVNNGYYLKGWATDANGNVVGGLQTIDTSSVATIAAATTNASLTANLPADAAVNDTFTSTLEIYDSLGTAVNTAITWQKTGDNTWTATFSDPTLASSASQTVGSVSSSAITIAFNPDGTLASTTPSPPVLSISGWSTGAADQTITLDLGKAGSASGLSQYSSGSTNPSVSLVSDQDGMAFGSMTGITIGDEGTVYARYDNGQQRAIYKVAVTTFTNPNGLEASSGGIYVATATSGTATLHIAGRDGAGTITGSSLEMSTTDTNTEFSNMMSAQQAYSAAAQVITAANKMFDTLISAVR